VKAAVYERYGPPDVVQIQDVEKPSPADNEVLIRVRAASVNPADSHLMEGKPYVGRIVFGLRKPKLTRPGFDVAGQVEAVGKNVTRFKPGDEVFGSSRGSFAEYVCTPESKLVLKPPNISFEQAASVPVAAYTALQGLRDKGHIRPGYKVLINGAAGGVGTFAVQIARAFGAEVTGVCSTRNVDLVRSLGAARVIDYTREDFTQGDQRYDLIFDLVANHSLPACRRIMTPKGAYIGAGVLGLSMFHLPFRLLAVALLSRSAGQTFVNLMAKSNQENLATMYQLLKDGKVTPVVDRCYPLSEAAEAIRYLAEGHARGKVVIIIDSSRHP